MITIYLIDDHDLVRESLIEKLNACAGLHVVGGASNMEEGLAGILEVKPQILLLDIRLQEASGLQMLEPIKQQVPGTRIIMLTMYDHPRYALEAMKKGADGFVLKGASFGELEKAIRSVRNNQPYVTPALAARLVGKMGEDPSSRPIDKLSPREFEVMVQIGQGAPLKEVASLLGINEKSVSTYLSRLMEKLHLDSRAELVRFVIEEGLLD